ncbi:Leucine--tRNA ligase [Candidatus Burarchaeum australiense]|nr:Leucine--tRNA ligase [Candidatus Burarchaeum australiense]
MDFSAIEAKWRQKWDESQLFEAVPAGEMEKFYLTAAFPYPNSPQHIGHGRTYTTTDVYARYKRMCGKNVLFPMGFHVTGTPIIAMAKRLAARDPEIIKIFRDIYGIPEEKIASLTDPVSLVSYFSKEIEDGMREMGYSIDWRRKFYSFDPMFNKFIQWQFKKLKDAGLITKGSHPVPWCPKDNQAIGAHDTQGDVDPELGEFVLVKFKFRDGYLLTATFRPETIYGVTSVWFNPQAEHVKCEIGGEAYYITKAAAERMTSQFAVKILETFPGTQLEGQTCINPINGKPVPLFPASFVDPANGSGVVMSVPAHAPYDFLALRDLGKATPDLLVQVLRIDGYGNFPAKEICEKMGITGQEDVKAEAATKEIYSKEAHTGVMVVGKYAGKGVMEAKELIKKDMLAEKQAITMHEIINGPVKCRCGALCTVKLVQDQWFIDYGNEKWKQFAHACLAQMKIIPEAYRGDYNYTIDWLHQKACTRNQGLGTKFPFDETKMIEALSDSTIYMAFYTIAHKIRDWNPERLDENFFNYVLLGEGTSSPDLDEIRNEFVYWYPLDSSHSATDLVHNHLTYFIFNHVAILPSEYWPKQIVTNGFVLMDGQKMSKSMGNILPLRKAIKKYGADVVRFSVVSGADLSQDSDFNETLAGGIISRINFIESLLSLKHNPRAEERPIDKWLLSRLHRRMRDAPAQYENFELRALTQELFYQTVNDLRHYLKRSSGPEGGEPGPALREYLENWCLLMAPFTPHVAEEMWEKMGKKYFAEHFSFTSTARFPQADESKINEGIERAEDFILSVKADIEHILEIVKRKPARISLFTAADWKRTLMRMAFEEKKFDTAIKRAMELEEIKEQGDKAAKLLQTYVKSINKLTASPPEETFEFSSLRDASDYFSQEFGCQVVVASEDKAAGEAAKKAGQALPGKPAIFIE